MGYSPRGHRELDTTEGLSMHAPKPHQMEICLHEILYFCKPLGIWGAHLAPRPALQPPSSF